MNGIFQFSFIIFLVPQAAECGIFGKSVKAPKGIVKNQLSGMNFRKKVAVDIAKEKKLPHWESDLGYGVVSPLAEKDPGILSLVEAQIQNSTDNSVTSIDMVLPNDFNRGLILPVTDLKIKSGNLFEFNRWSDKNYLVSESYKLIKNPKGSKGYPGLASRTSVIKDPNTDLFVRTSVVISDETVSYTQRIQKNPEGVDFTAIDTSIPNPFYWTSQRRVTPINVREFPFQNEVEIFYTNGMTVRFKWDPKKNKYRKLGQLNEKHLLAELESEINIDQGIGTIVNKGKAADGLGTHSADGSKSGPSPSSQNGESAI
jgi:hypothetical protein